MEPTWGETWDGFWRISRRMCSKGGNGRNRAHFREKDLKLFGYVSEKGYEGSGHWLMFLFDCKKPISQLPESFDEGSFAFFGEMKSSCYLFLRATMN